MIKKHDAVAEQATRVKIFAGRNPESVEVSANQFIASIPHSQISEVRQETKVDAKKMALIYIIKVKYINQQ